MVHDPHTAKTKAIMDTIVANTKRVIPFQLPAIILHESPTEHILNETVEQLLNEHMHVIEAALEACLKRTIDFSHFYQHVSNRSEVYIIGTNYPDEKNWDYVVPEIFFSPGIWVPTKAQLYEWHDWLKYCYERGHDVPNLEYHQKTIDEWTFHCVKEVLRGIYAHAEKLRSGFAPFSYFANLRDECFRERAVEKKLQEEEILRNTRILLLDCSAPDFLTDEYDRRLYKVKLVRRRIPRYNHP